MTAWFAVLLATGSCVRGVREEPRVHWSPPGGQDSIVPLRQRPPGDSVILHRGGATILLSMRDVEEYHSLGPLPRDVERFRDEMRREFQRSGWVSLGDGMLPDLLAGRLLQSGRAAVRIGPRNSFAEYVHFVLERNVNGDTVVRHRSFYSPEGVLILRVFDGVTIS
jgi:hypothetical protein